MSDNITQDDIEMKLYASRHESGIVLRKPCYEIISNLLERIEQLESKVNLSTVPVLDVEKLKEYRIPDDRTEKDPAHGVRTFLQINNEING